MQKLKFYISVFRYIKDLHSVGKYYKGEGGD